MKKNQSQKGQALILIALAIVGLVGFSALAIDGGRVLSDRRHAQNAADTAALAAALEKIQSNSNPNAITEALTRAASNGYNDDGAASEVEVNIPPVSGPYAGNTQYIQVIIHSYVPTTFARVLGRTVVENTVEAVTRVQGSTSSGSFFSGAGMASTRDDDSDQCFLINGNADLTLVDTGIFVNCSGDEALFINGGANVELGANAEVAGCAKDQGGNLSGDGTIVCDVPQQPVDETMFANVPTTLPTPTCSSAGAQSGNTLSPGYFNGNVSMNSTVTLEPGTYCFNGGLNINGSANLKGTGTVKIVLGDGSLNLNGADNTFDDLELYVNNGDFRVTGSLTANRLRFFSTGTGDFIVNNGTLTCDNTYLYSYRGEITINSTSVVNIGAPPQGDTFGGLLIHMPWGNTNAFILNGGTEDNLRGTIMVPTSDVTYNGGAGFELYGQIIGYTFKVNGSGNTKIIYSASDTYTPAADPSIEIAQ
jgi:hypothetical protein